jgi:hypothetical protein
MHIVAITKGVWHDAAIVIRYLKLRRCSFRSWDACVNQALSLIVRSMNFNASAQQRAIVQVINGESWSLDHIDACCKEHGWRSETTMECNRRLGITLHGSYVVALE